MLLLLGQFKTFADIELLFSHLNHTISFKQPLSITNFSKYNFKTLIQALYSNIF